MNSIIDNVHFLNSRTQSILKHIELNGPHVGDYKWSCRSNDYNGWILCDGRSVARDDYINLFHVTGTAFGSTNSNSFNLPNFQGRVMAGASSSHVVGVALGAETHTLDVTQIPGHTHTGSTGSAGAHTHSITDPGHTHSQTTINDDFNSSAGTPPGFIGDSSGSRTWDNINPSTTGITVNSGGAHTHNFTTDSTGGGLAHNNMQPTLYAGHVFIYTGFHGSQGAEFVPN